MDIKPEIKGRMQRRPQKILAAILACGLAAGIAAGAYSLIMKDIRVKDEDKVYEIRTSSGTVKEALDEMGIKLNPGDVVEPEQETKLYDGLEVTITRAISIKIFADGRTIELLTTKKTVQDALDMAGIKLAPMDKIEPELQSHLQSGDSIRITRVTQGYIEEDVVLPYHQVRRENPQMEKGFSRTVSHGQEGLKRIVYKVTYEDGIEKQREIKEERIIRQPQDNIVEYGTLALVATSRGQARFKRALNMVATAYCACEKCTGKNPGDRGYGITRSGIPVKPGIAAVDPKVIPLGSNLYVEGYGFALAADTGSAIKGNRIDLYYPTHKESENYGVKRIKVYILE